MTVGGLEDDGDLDEAGGKDKALEGVTHKVKELDVDWETLVELESQHDSGSEKSDLTSRPSPTQFSSWGRFLVPQ